MKDVFHTLVRQQRQNLAMSEDDIATILSMTSAEFCDLEAYPDEWRTVVPTIRIKVLFRLLKIDMRRVVCPATKTLEIRSLNEFIRSRRLELGLSPSEFAEKVGFDQLFCDVIENYALGLELYPVQVAAFVADVLQISSEEFVDWILRHRCNDNVCERQNCRDILPVVPRHRGYRVTSAQRASAHPAAIRSPNPLRQILRDQQ